MAIKDKAWLGKGTCPFCKSVDTFRKPTYFENAKDVTVFLGNMLVSSKSARRRAAFEFGKDITTESGSFPNFVCTSCGGKLHQCGGCKAMVPYQDFGKCPKCGYG